MANCINKCQDLAEVLFQWHTSQGPQEAKLCGVCAASWWQTYKSTPSGESLIIASLQEK